jgi:small conductance mechanosensitive channel
MLRGLLAGYPVWAAGAMSLAIGLSVAYLVSEVAARIGRALLTRVLREDAAAAKSPVLRRPVQAIRVTVFAVVGMVLLFPALKVAGIDVRVGFEPEAVVSWFLESGARIALIILLAGLVLRATSSAVRKFEHEAGRGESLDALERAKRVRTLGTLIENVMGVIAVGAALLMILRELNVDVLPLLTGAGIVGLAIGFGAQTLVKDVISGFFMILENQVRVGDVAVINGVSGVVESMKLRTITLRDVEGTVHVFPNGSVNTLANKSKDFSYAVLDVPVAYKEDTDRVIDVLRAVGEELRADSRFQASILQPMEIFGIEALSESSVTIKVRLKTLPLSQWDVARELRRRIKRAFEANGIEMPLAQRTLYVAGNPVPGGRLTDVRAAEDPPQPKPLEKPE